MTYDTVAFIKRAAEATLHLSCLTNFVEDPEYKSLDHMAWMLKEIATGPWDEDTGEINHWLGWAQAGLVFYCKLTRDQIEQINNDCR